MDQTWAERHGAVRPAGPAAAGQNPAARSANGTGPYALVSREPGIRTVLRRNEAYWGRGEAPLDIDEVVFRPIPDGRARVEALLSGEVDFVQDVPVGQIARLSEMRDIRLNTSPENRSVFLGLNVGAPELRSSDVRGRNPFADRRVREALSLAIDRDALRRGVMQDQSVPAGVIVPPFSNGYTDALDRVPAPDPGRARALLAEAGYPDGFGVTLHCTNDRYLSDAELCRAIAEMLTNVGVRTKPQTWPAARHFPAVRRAELDLYLLGWGVSTFDSEYIFSLLYHTNAGDLGGWNGTGFSNGEIDARDPLAPQRDRRQPAQPHHRPALGAPQGRDDLRAAAQPDRHLRHAPRLRHPRGRVEPAEDQVRRPARDVTSPPLAVSVAHPLSPLAGRGGTPRRLSPDPKTVNRWRRSWAARSWHRRRSPDGPSGSRRRSGRT